MQLTIRFSESEILYQKALEVCLMDNVSLAVAQIASGFVQLNEPLDDPRDKRKIDALLLAFNSALQRTDRKI